MFNVITDKITKIAIIAAIALSGISCGNSGKTSDEAEAMLNEAQQMSDEGRYDSAVVMLDSLCKTRPTETDAVKQAMHLKAQTLEKSFVAQMAQVDSIIAANAPIVEKIAPIFKAVKTPEMVEGYRVVASIAGKELINRTDIEPRIDDGGNLYIVSLLHGVAAEHDHLRVSCGAGSAETKAVPYDKSRNYRFSDDGVTNEMVTFRYDECADFCQFIADNADAKLSLTFVGKKQHTVPLSNALKRAIVESYRYSTAIRTGMRAEHDKLLLTKKIEIARRQIEQTAIDKE